MRSRRKIILGAVGIGFLLRLRAVPREIGDVDGVNFARALAEFDPLHQAPHLPGYPVYVAAARVFANFDLATTWALALPGLLLFPIGALVLFAGVRDRFGEPHALGALLFTCFAPPAVLFGGWPTSDGFGFALLCSGIGLLWVGPGTGSESGRKAVPRVHVRLNDAQPQPATRALTPSQSESRSQSRSFTAGLLFGLLLGVRLSWWLIAISAALFADDRRRFTAGLALGSAAWIAALLFFVPPTALFEGALAFAHGHFTDWGVTTELGLFARVVLAACVVAIALLLPRALAIAAIPYTVWIVLAQNLEHPRHLLPLIPIAGITTGALIRNYRLPTIDYRLAVPTAIAIVLTAVLAYRQGTELPPAAALAYELRARSPERLQVFAGESAPVIRHLAPAVRVWRPASQEVLEREAELARSRGADVVILEELHARR